MTDPSPAGYLRGYPALMNGTRGELPEVKRDADEFAATEARRTELRKLTRAELAELHPRGAEWPKDVLIRAVLEDEGYLWHPEAGPEPD